MLIMLIQRLFGCIYRLLRMIWRSGSRKVLGTAVEGTLYAAGGNGGRQYMRRRHWLNCVDCTAVQLSRGTRAA